MPAARCQWLHEPTPLDRPLVRTDGGVLSHRAPTEAGPVGAGTRVGRHRRRRRTPDRRHDEYIRRGHASLSERVRDQPRVADAPEHRRRVPPQRSTGGQRRHGPGMVVDIRHVRDRVAVDRTRRTRHGGRAHRCTEIAWQGERAHRGVMVEIAEGVDRGHVEARPVPRIRRPHASKHRQQARVPAGRPAQPHQATRQHGSTGLRKSDCGLYGGSGLSRTVRWSA